MDHKTSTEIIEKTDNHTVFFFSSYPGYFSDFFDEKFIYQITVLVGQVRVMSNGKNNERFFLQKNFIEIERGEKFQLQNISNGNMKLLIVKYK
jgi:hypothetical protein